MKWINHKILNNNKSYRICIYNKLINLIRTIEIQEDIIA